MGVGDLLHLIVGADTLPLPSGLRETRCATGRVRGLGGLSSYESHRPNTAPAPSRCKE
jgi:hypothetical protein